MDFYRFYLILSESRDLLGFYCGASIVYNIMLNIELKSTQDIDKHADFSAEVDEAIPTSKSGRQPVLEESLALKY